MLSWRKSNVGFAAAAAMLMLVSCGMDPKFLPLQHSLPEMGGTDARKIYDRLKALTPGARLIEGMTIANIRCDQFFEDLDEHDTYAQFASGRLANLTAALPGVLNGSGVSKLAVANTLAAIGFADSWLKDKKTLFLLTEFKSEVYNNWQQSRDLHFRKNLRVALFLNGKVQSTGNDKIDRLLQNDELAESIVNTALYEYARLCLRSQLKKYIYDHVRKPITTSLPGNGRDTETTITTEPGGTLPADPPDQEGPIFNDGRSERRAPARTRRSTRVIRKRDSGSSSSSDGDFIWTKPLYGGGQ